MQEVQVGPIGKAVSPLFPISAFKARACIQSGSGFIALNHNQLYLFHPWQSINSFQCCFKQSASHALAAPWPANVEAPDVSPVAGAAPPLPVKAKFSGQLPFGKKAQTKIVLVTHKNIKAVIGVGRLFIGFRAKGQRIRLKRLQAKGNKIRFVRRTEVANRSAGQGRGLMR